MSELQILSNVGRKQSRGSAVAWVRDLGPADLPLVQNPPPIPPGAADAGLTRIRNTHHALARLLAQGLPQVQISEITGYSPSRISVLKSDPMFQELVAYYAEQGKEIFVDVNARIAELGVMALEELKARLEEDPAKVSNSMLLNLIDGTIGPRAKPPGVPAGGAAGAAVSLNISFQAPLPQAESGVVIEGSKVPAGDNQ